MLLILLLKSTAYDVYDIFASYNNETSENSLCAIKCDCLEQLLSMISIIRVKKRYRGITWDSDSLIHMHPLQHLHSDIHAKGTACLNVCMQEQTRNVCL